MGLKTTLGSSLAVQWLGLGAFTVMLWVQSLLRELRAHKLSGAAKKKEKHHFFFLTSESLC